MHRPTKISNLDFTMYAHQYVLRLDVTVNNMFLVEVLQSFRHLRNILSSLPFRKAVLAPQVLVQFTLSRKLEDEEDALRVVEAGNP